MDKIVNFIILILIYNMVFHILLSNFLNFVIFGFVYSMKITKYMNKLYTT